MDEQQHQSLKSSTDLGMYKHEVMSIEICWMLKKYDVLQRLLQLSHQLFDCATTLKVALEQNHESIYSKIVYVYQLPPQQLQHILLVPAEETRLLNNK